MHSGICGYNSHRGGCHRKKHFVRRRCARRDWWRWGAGDKGGGWKAVLEQSRAEEASPDLDQRVMITPADCSQSDWLLIRRDHVSQSNTPFLFYFLFSVLLKFFSPCVGFSFLFLFPICSCGSSPPSTPTNYLHVLSPAVAVVRAFILCLSFLFFAFFFSLPPTRQNLFGDSASGTRWLSSEPLPLFPGTYSENTAVAKSPWLALS